MRFLFQTHFKDGQGRVISGGTITVYLAGTTTLATIYSVASGGSPISGSQVTTASDGGVSFWTSDSDFSLNQKFKITMTKADFATKSYDNITIFAPVPTGVYYPDANAADQGAATTGGYSLKDIIDAAGSNNITIKFRNSSGSATTSYTLTTSETIPATCAIELEIGAKIVQGGSATLTINAPVVGNPMHQLFSGFAAGEVIFGANSRATVYPEWWYSGSGVYNTAIQSAINAFSSITFNGAYTIDASITLTTNKNLHGFTNHTNSSSITITTANDIFIGAGTKTAHLSNIAIDGLKFVGQEVTITKYALNIKWVDNLKVINCEAENIKLVYASELDTDSYGGINISQIQDTHTIENNRIVLTALTGNDQSLIMLRYVKHFKINNNIIKGLGGAVSGAGVYCFGGDCNPASDGQYGYPRKCFNGVINNNIIKGQISGVNVAQSEGITITGNTFDDAGETIWVGASKNVVSAGNTVINCDNNCLQTQGLCENVVFDGNSIHMTAIATVFYVGSAWTTEYNIGPISFINNTVKSDVANLAAFYDTGQLVIKNNTVYNTHFAAFGKIAQLEVENNSFIYDLFIATGNESTYLLRLSQFNATMSGLSGITNLYTSIKGNIWHDRTGNWTTGSVIRIYDPITTSNLYIEDNTFKTKNTNWNILLATTSTSIALSTFIRNNKFAGLIDTKSNNTATTSHVYFLDNYKVDGTHYLGTYPTDNTIHHFSLGSRFWADVPATLTTPGWICTTAGAPGTWKAMANLA